MLDFDGVLHPEGCARGDEFCHVDALQQVLRQVPKVKIVISSLWRVESSLEQLRSHFAADIAARIAGVTPDLFDGEFNVPALRQRECEQWIRENDPGSRWLALDDRDDGFEPGCPHVLLVPRDFEGGTGLESHHLEDLLLRLRALVYTARPSRRARP